MASSSAMASQNLPPEMNNGEDNGEDNGEKADLLCWGCWWEIKLRTERIQSRMQVPYRLGDVLEPSYQYSWLQIGCYPEPAATTMDRKSIHWMSCSGRCWQKNLHHPNKSIRIEDRWSSDSQVRCPPVQGVLWKLFFPFDQDWTYRNLRTVENAKQNLHTTCILGSTFCNSFLAWSVGNANLAHCYCPFLSLGAPKWSPHETKRSGYILLNRSREITWRCKKENTISILFLRWMPDDRIHSSFLSFKLRMDFNFSLGNFSLQFVLVYIPKS